MKYSIRILFLLIMSSCAKSNHEFELDKISYVVLKDSIVTSIDSSSFNPYKGCFVYFPAESTAIYDLDIDNNGQKDFQVSHKHFVGCYWGGPHCCEYENYLIQIYGLNKNKICIGSEPGIYLPAKKFINGDIIDKNNFWSDSSILYLESVKYHIGSYSIDSNLIGYQLLNSDSIFYGWLKININPKWFIIKEYATNFTNNNPILAGQKK